MGFCFFFGWGEFWGGCCFFLIPGEEAGPPPGLRYLSGSESIQRCVSFKNVIKGGKRGERKAVFVSKPIT